MLLLITTLAGFTWITWDTFRNLTVPRQEYLKIIRQQALMTGGQWANEILLHGSVKDRFSDSKRRNIFCLRQLVYEGLIEVKDGTTGIGADSVQIPVAIFNLTPQGLRHLYGE